CETATGDKRAALGLARIAVRAGARSTLATLWSVSDRSTSELMSNFYHQLTDNQLPKAEAVRQAQLFLLHHPWYKHPYYWSSYVLLGNWM
ncbi:MAG: CHAT domain-containing protein, partial [Waterburya sp.]